MHLESVCAATGDTKLQLKHSSPGFSFLCSFCGHCDFSGIVGQRISAHRSNFATSDEVVSTLARNNKVLIGRTGGGEEAAIISLRLVHYFLQFFPLFRGAFLIAFECP